MTASDVTPGRAPVPGVLTWRRFLVAGLALTAAVMVVPGWTGEVLWDVVPLLACAAMVVGIRRHPGPHARAWWWLAAGTAWWALADLGWTAWYAAVGGDADLVPWWFDIVYMATYPLLVVGLTRLPRNSLRSRHESATMDAVVVVVGTGLLYWALVFRSFLGPDALQDAAHLVSVVSLGAGLGVVLMASRLLFRYGGRNGAYALLGCGVAASTAGDVLYTLTLIGDGNPGISVLDTSLAEGVGSAAWLVWFVLFGAAALHPGVAGSPDAEPSRGLTLARGVVFFLLASLGPAALLLTFRVGSTVTMPWSDLAVPVLAVTALSAFLVTRLVVGTSTAQRRAIALDRQAAELARALDEQSALQKLLSHQAQHDPLTGLGNRTRFTERLSAPDRRGNGERAVLMVDLDGFKTVNDDHGHHAGDDLLVQVARRLRRVVGGDDTLARLGGDEFAVVLEDTHESDARDVATRVVRALGEPFVVDGRTVRITSSVGVRLVDASVEPQATLRDADLALYAAKAAGKNQVRLFDPSLRVAQDRRSHLAEGLRHAVERDELVVHYQPVVSLGTGRVQSVEALLRWQSPDGLVMPDGFIPVAEDTGLIVPIGEHVLRRACADVRPWFERHGVRVHVNVSARQLREPDVVEQVLHALRDASLPGRALVLEITETALLAAEEPEATLVESHLSRLREHGVRVAIDDFGTGYSSLAYLQRLPVDIVKIDGAFTRFAAEPGEEGRRRRALASAIVDLCRSLDLPAVAEQIETDDEADALRALGCPEGQGYLFGRPAPREEIGALLDGPARLRSVPSPRSAQDARRPV
ncbi:EAL domain-containing protein [Cellulomonas sp. H30R-01]|uniref:putative bifunctional diguanylate cyclase/phosphodiesterase n=1 Tax=Cellulomonas sp. H30R-01 TaxID=2704467 RepID=UPI00138D111E|nr:EAL domain-containing protein [Cellulomonas sp. H30R-01]QHT55029.1 EAL domain-containing protein [Cellulomonas sp. H30R-01]